MRVAWNRIAVMCLLTGCDVVFGLTGPGGVRDAAPSCGHVAEPCCDAISCIDGTQCLAGPTGNTRCVAFAGTYQTSQANSCGAPTCLLAEPHTQSCGCPSNFGVGELANLDEGCGSDALAPMNLLGAGQLCGISSLPPASDWGGAYLSSDIPACEPNTTPPNCLMVNPITQACTCPANAEQVALRVFVPGVVGSSCVNGWLGGTLGVCLMPGVPVASIAGVYEQDAQHACRVHSSALSGCTCPAGTIGSQLRSIEESVDRTLLVETTITFCVVEL
jgi:hypothetical protein